MLYILNGMYACRPTVPEHANTSSPKRDGRSAKLRGTARERLLDAAFLEFGERGYAATSLQAIADRAGLTKGAIYWSFRDKQELLLALLEERLEEPARGLMRLTETAPPDVETAPLVSAGFAAIVRERPEILLLAVEQWALAAREETVRVGYRRRQQALREAIAHTLQTRHETLGVPLAYPAERLAMGMIALSFGLAMEALVDPVAAPEELLGEILGLIYDGLVYRAGRAGS